jgi:hypothetical protein
LYKRNSASRAFGAAYGRRSALRDIGAACGFSGKQQKDRPDLFDSYL